jgi:hypothetical protein
VLALWADQLVAVAAEEQQQGEQGASHRSSVVSPM